MQFRVLRLATVILISTSSSLTRASEIDVVEIDFDDGAVGTEIGDFYRAMGVDFENGRWRDASVPNSSPPLAIDAFEPTGPDNTHFALEDAIVINLLRPVEEIRIRGLDISSAGAQVDVFNSQGVRMIGQSVADNSGAIDFDFKFSIPGIKQVRLFQPNYNGEDGLVFDDLTLSIRVGDYDGSGVVDRGDYDIWNETFGSTVNLAADGNMDGIVDAADYTVWRDALDSVAAASATHAPEPGALFLLLATLAIAGVSRNRTLRVKLR